MENNSIPQQPYYPPQYVQSPNHWKTAMIVFLVVIIGGIAVWIFKSQLQPVQVQNNYQQKQSTHNTPYEPISTYNQTVPPLTVSQPLISKSAPSLLYAYNNYSSNTAQVYRSDIYGKNKLEINIGYLAIGESGRFVSSRNKKYLAQWYDTQLEVASAQNPSAFKKIAGINKPNTRVSQAIFSPNGAKIAFIIKENLEPDKDFGQIENNLYTINVDGTNQRLVKKFRTPEYVALEGLNVDKNELYWFETGEGGVSNFTIVNLFDGSIKEIKKDLDPYSSLIDFTFNFSKTYYIKDSRIIEYTLANDNKQILYTLDDTSTPSS